MSTENDENKTGNAPVRPHVADDIQEYDNPLPRWWVGMFYLCTIFAVGYFAYYHFMGGTSLLAELNQTLTARDEARNLAKDNAEGSPTSAVGVSLEAVLGDPQQISAGKEHFAQNCAPCHGQSGEGLIGPNLTDAFWLHGGKPDDIRRTIAQGVPDKGMIAWESILDAQKIASLTAFIVSIKGTNPPNAKPPQGNEEP